MKDLVSRADPAEPRRWARIRLALGTAQMFCAALSAVLLVKTGVSRLCLGSVVLTCVLTTASVLMFGSRAPRNEP
jgi:hypothetical protein